MTANANMLRWILGAIGMALVAYAISDHPFYGGAPGFGAIQAAILGFGLLTIGCAFIRKDWLAGACMLVASTLGTIGIAELLAEALFAKSLRPIYQYDQELIFRLLPNAEAETTRLPANGGQTVRHRTNSLGMRGDELDLEDNAPRILVYGDSFIHASYSQDEDTFCGRLQSEIASQFDLEATVVNAGVSSYSPDQVLIRMQTELESLAPDLVIVSIFAGNDYGDLLRKKLFRLNGDGELEENAWTLQQRQKIAFELNHRESLLKRMTKTALSSRQVQSGLTVLTFDTALAQSTREYEEYVLQGNNVVSNAYTGYYSADIALRPDSPSAQYKVNLMTQIIGQIATAANEAAVPLALLIIPSPHDLIAGYDGWMRDTAKYPSYNERNLTAPLEAAARDFSIPHLNLHDVLAQRDPGRLFFIENDNHWNDAGQKIAASAMADYLGRSGLIEKLRSEHN